MFELRFHHSRKVNDVEGIDQLSTKSSKMSIKRVDMDWWNKLFCLSKTIGLFFIRRALIFKAINTLRNILGISSCVCDPITDIFTNISNIIYSAISCFGDCSSKDFLNILDPVV